MVENPAVQQHSRTLTCGELSWLEAGSGEAIVFLHGIGSAARSFKAQLEGLSARRRTLAWDMPGYGSSAGFSEDAPDVAAYADVAAEWLETLAIGSCHVVGHSLGSLVAARFAAAHPERILTLTLASCALGHARLPETERSRLLASRIDDVRTLGPRGMAEKRGPRLLGPDASPAAINAVIDVMAAIDPRGYAQAARMLSGGDMLADLARIPPSIPVQIVYGLADVITPPEVNLRAARTRPAASIATIERAGHAHYVEASGRFNDIVERFVGATR